MPNPKAIICLMLSATSSKPNLWLGVFTCAHGLKTFLVYRKKEGNMPEADLHSICRILICSLILPSNFLCGSCAGVALYTVQASRILL